MSKSISEEKPSYSAGKLWLFRIIAISLPFLLFALIEMGFRLFSDGDDQRDPFVNISPVAVFSRTNIEGVEYYKISHNLVLGGHTVRFPVKKPANTLRIFCLGSSACAGWPHGPDDTFQAYLSTALERAYPGKKIEVINAAAHGFAAYRDRRVLDEVIQMQPDAILVWEGNNEFLEDRNYDTSGALLLGLARHLHTVQWLRSQIAPAAELKGGELKDVAHFFWTRSRQISLRLREDPVQFAQVQKHFDTSFDYMVRCAQQHAVPIILCTVPVNQRDWLPTVSHNRLKEQALEKWDRHYYAARHCLIDSRWDEGLHEMDAALALEPEHAESHFWRGRLLEGKGDSAGAATAYSRARDLDYNPFRALSSFNSTIRQLAADNRGQGVFLLDLETAFQRASQYPAPGFDLFLDYVHPTKAGNMLVARFAYELIAHGGVFARSATPFNSDIEGKPFNEQEEIPTLVCALNMATMNRQYPEVVRRTESLAAAINNRPAGPLNETALASCPPQIAEGYRIFRAYCEAEANLITGAPGGADAFKKAQEDLSAFYDKWFPYGKY